MSKLTKSKKWNDILQLLKRGIRHLFLHNGWVKLLAVLISIALWAGLISQDPNITRNKTFQNVIVSTQGSPSGFVVTTDLSGLTTEITASVPQLQYENAEASAYNIRVDLSSIKSAGEQELKILSSEHSEYGRVTRTNPSTVKVMVEELVPFATDSIVVEPIGDIPDGWYIAEQKIGTRSITVNGAASIINDIANITVTLDMNAVRWEDGATTPYLGKIKVYNQKQEDITPLVKKSTDSARVTVTVKEEYKSKTNVPVNVRTEGEVPENWYISVSSVLDEGITVSGPASEVKNVASAGVTLNLSELKWEEGTIELSGDIKLYNLQQEEISSTALTITNEENVIEHLPITATILPTKDFSLDGMISYTGKPADGYEVTGVTISAETVTIAGTADKLEEIGKLPPEQLAVKILKNSTVDVTGLSENKSEELSVKTLVFSKDQVIIIKPDKVYVTVEIAPVPDTGDTAQAPDAADTALPPEP